MKPALDNYAIDGLMAVRRWAVRALAAVVVAAGCNQDATAPLTPTTPAPIVRDSRYPAHWWTPVSSEGAPDWEILPQAAGPGEVILSKRHELGLLSNFAPTPFTFHGRRYASLEGFWQMMLYPEGEDDPRAQFAGLKWEFTRDQVGQMTAFEAKHAGDLGLASMSKMSIDWVSFKGRHFPYRSAEPGEHYRLIVAATRQKVRQNPEVERVLLATGELVLKPDHHQEPSAPPEWRYFEILTQIRAELQRGETIEEDSAAVDAAVAPEVTGGDGAQPAQRGQR